MHIIMTNEQLHQFRKYIDMAINSAEQDITPEIPYDREMRIVHTKLQEAKMWTGKCLEVAGSPFPPELADKASEGSQIAGGGTPGGTATPEPAPCEHGYTEYCPRCKCEYSGMEGGVACRLACRYCEKEKRQFKGAYLGGCAGCGCTVCVCPSTSSN